ncbi:MAG TPA: hypothetical protein VN944_04965 [Nitrospiria bacterium]|nr:hypothetical protein [Nitrospiria bacterium]
MTRYFDLKRLFLIGIVLFWGCGLPAGVGPVPPFFTVSISPMPISSPASFISTTKFYPNPQVAADKNNNVFVVWQNYSTSSIFYTYSTNAGATFTTLGSVPGSSGGSYPRIATDGSGNAFITWYVPSATPSIQFNYTIANVFQLALPLTVSSTSVPFPSAGSPSPEDINVSNGTLALAWNQCTTVTPSCTDNEVYATSFAVSVTTIPITQASFNTAPNLISGTGNLSTGYPKIKQYNNQSYIQYFQSGPSSTGLSLNINNTQTIPVFSGAPLLDSSLEIDTSGKVYSAWNPSYQPCPPPPQPNTDIFFSFLKSGNTLFTMIGNGNLTNNGCSFGPALAIDSSQYVNLAFFSFPTGLKVNDLFLSRSTDGGNTFPNFYNLSSTPAGTSASYAPGFTVVGKTAYLVWDEAVAVGAFTTSQIYFEKLSLN